MRYLPDANLFVAAVKNARRETDTLRLPLALLEDPSIELVGGAVLFAEFERAAAAFPSPLAAGLLHAIAERLTLVEPDDGVIAACAPFFAGQVASDIVHAATCLKSGATLISNDHDFDAIVRAGLIRRLTLTEAVRRLL